MERQKRILLGYTRNYMKEIMIDEEQAEVVKLIFELRVVEFSAEQEK